MNLKDTAFFLAVGVICWCGLASAQQASTPVIPPDARAAAQGQAWTKISISPLHPFHPEQPTRIELKNGLVILLEPDHELPFINGAIMIRGGSRDLPADKTGMVDLYANAWRTSGTTAMSGDKLDDMLEAKAAKVETGGGVDSTFLMWSCLTRDEDRVFESTVDLLEHPAFNEQKLVLAKQRETTIIARRNDSPAGIAQREAARLVYGPDSPYARQPEFSTVTQVTMDDLKAWHAKTVHPNNMIVSVEGDFDPAVMEQALRTAFEGLPRGPEWPRQEVEFPGPKPGVYSINKADVNQSNVWIVGLGTERSNPDYYALSVMNQIFGGGFGSRLFQDVRTKQGLAYSVSGGYGFAYDHPGMFYATTSTKSESTVKATQAILDQIAMLKTKPFTEAELTSAKDQLLSSFIFHYDTQEKVLMEARMLAFYGYPADFLEKYREGIEAVTLADLDRTAKKYIEPSKLAVLVVGNESQYGVPLTDLKLGPARAIDITIPMPAPTEQQDHPGME